MFLKAGERIGDFVLGFVVLGQSVARTRDEMEQLRTGVEEVEEFAVLLGSFY